jgi:hypothetical protein
MEVRRAVMEDVGMYADFGRAAQPWLRARGLEQYVPAAHDEYADSILARVEAGTLCAVWDGGSAVAFFSLDPAPSPWWPGDGEAALYLAGRARSSASENTAACFCRRPQSLRRARYMGKTTGQSTSLATNQASAPVLALYVFPSVRTRPRPASISTQTLAASTSPVAARIAIRISSTRRHPHPERRRRSADASFYRESLRRELP